MTDKLPHDVSVLADAYGMHIRLLGKYWALAATVTVLAFTADTSSSPIEFFGFKFKSDFFYPACAIFGAILNFAYCISHLQAYRAGEIFRQYLSTTKANERKLTGEYSEMDAAHLLVPSAINRVFPILHFLPGSVGTRRLVQYLKLPVDVFVFILPISGCVYASFQLHLGWVSLAIWPLVIISALVSAVLTYTGIRWLFNSHASQLPER